MKLRTDASNNTYVAFIKDSEKLYKLGLMPKIHRIELK